MRVLKFALLFALLDLNAATAASLSYTLPDETATLKPGSAPNFDAAQNNCVACHSSDYISTQPSKRGQAFWTAEVTKMIKVYHAPINEADAKRIAAYLSEQY